MKVKMVLPALVEARRARHQIKYALFPPLGLATLAGYLDENDEVTIQDEHVEGIDLDDKPDLVAIEVYITSAYRAYAVADHYRSEGAYVALGGLHVTALPGEAAQHADTICLGPGEATWPAFLGDFRAGRPGKVYRSQVRSLIGVPRPRRDLLRRERYLVPNSLVVSRGCPHRCDFCYQQSFFHGGRSFYTQQVDAALAEIASLPGRHLFFLDDHLFADGRFATALFEGMRGMGRIWQAAGTVEAILRPGLIEMAARSGLRSLFVGFETLDPANLAAQHKQHNLNRDYALAVRRLHDLGVMVNASFVFGMDGDDATVFGRTVEWAVERGIETATFHILTPYPGTALHRRLTMQGRITDANWDCYDTRHVVFRPARTTSHQLEAGYRQAYREFYRWRSIGKAAFTKPRWSERLRHVAYVGGWKKCEPLWDRGIRAEQVGRMRPLLEVVLGGAASGHNRAGDASAAAKTESQKLHQ